MAARREQAADETSDERGRRKPSVVAYRDPRRLEPCRHSHVGAERSAHELRYTGVEVLSHDAADVILPKDVVGESHIVVW